MTIKLEAIYENGELRPLSPLVLPEHARVQLAVDDLNDDERLRERSDLLLSGRQRMGRARNRRFSNRPGDGAAER